MSSNIRAFLSIDIDDETLLSRISHIQSGLDREAAKIKLVEHDNIHFTLRFLGDTPSTKIEKIREEFANAEFDAFTIRIKGVGAFPNIRRPRVIWVGVAENADKVTHLKLLADDLLGNLGYPRDKKFHAHATIARVRAVRNRDRIINNLESLANEAIGTMTVDCFRMTKSILTSSGPIYETLWEVGAS
ncbi:MAG: RNA 2',3'-cyclic phosphodiesterase [Candidatus Thorarchaeota archaeon]